MSDAETKLPAGDPEAEMSTADLLRSIYTPRILEFMAIRTKPINPELEERRERDYHNTPEWLTREQRLQMDRIYRQAYKANKQIGVPHQVDHIIPLRGKTVCGLCVPWNLRVITAAENTAKNNRLLPEFAGDGGRAVR